MVGPTQEEAAVAEGEPAGECQHSAEEGGVVAHCHCGQVPEEAAWGGNEGGAAEPGGHGDGEGKGEGEGGG